jgi:predicted nucleic acid-binding protein
MTFRDRRNSSAPGGNDFGKTGQMTLLDTDVLVDIQKGHPPAIVWMRQLTLADFAVPGAAVLELLAGSRNGNELQKSSDFVSRLQVAWLAEADNELAAQLVEDIGFRPA